MPIEPKSELSAVSAEGRYEALALHERDHVATAVAELAAGSEAIVEFPDGHREAFVVIELIPFGHKFALTDIAQGDSILKYGESIGAAVAAMRTGSHVHVHNVESQRGRGDLAAPHAGEESS